ncbi:MAG: hypothetical protein R2813_14060 [Flavobacteriales bacterium]
MGEFRINIRLIKRGHSGIVVLILFTILGCESYSQSTRHRSLDSAFNYIYEYRLKTAEKFIAERYNQYPSDPAWSMMMVNLSWAYLVSGFMEDEHWNQTFDQYLDRTEKIIAETKFTNNEHHFLYMLGKAFKTRKELLLENYLSAVTELNSCIHLVSKSFGKEDLYFPFHLTSGLYYYFMQKAYEDYILMRPYLMFYPDGDKEIGVDYLEQCVRSEDLFLRNEAQYFLMRIYFDLEEQYEKSLQYANSLVRDYPNNVVFRYFLYQSLTKLNRTEEADEQLNRLKHSISLNPELTPSQKSYIMHEFEIN